MDQEIKNTNKQEITYEDTCFYYVDNEGNRMPAITQLSAQSKAHQLKKGAEQGSPFDQKKLADCYFQGNEVEQSSVIAVEWLKKAAEQGYFPAYFPLAECYFDGIGIKQDYTQAVKWLKQCADYVFPSRRYWGLHQYEEEQKKAQCKLADCYFQGQGSENSPVKAIEWLEKAAEQGYEPAQFRLADCYFEGVGVTKNNKQGVEWLKKAARLLELPIPPIHAVGRQQFTLEGNRLAQRKLGFHYLKEENYTEAVKWFEEAVYSHKMQSDFLGAGKESIRAKTELGICYYYAKEYDLASKIFDSSFSGDNDCFWQIWLAYFTYRKNKSVAEKITPIERIKYSDRMTATHLGTLSSSEIEIENQRYEVVRKVKENEQRIAELFHKAAFGLFFSDEESNKEYFDIVSFAFPDDVICFLEHEKSSPAKVILAFYYRFQNKYEKYTEYLKQASIKQDILANYLLGKYYKNSKCFDKATNYLNKVDKEIKLKYSPLSEEKWSISGYSLGTQQFLVYSTKEELSDIKYTKENSDKEELYQKEIEEKNKQLQEAEKELEDMMSMFAHKFRSPLDAIIYNTTHENQVKLYTEAAQTMRGLLNIFSIISTDAEILKDKIKQDRLGSGRLATVFSKTLDMILLHLLSVSGAEKIQQHYMTYAKVHGQCDAQVSYKAWCEDYFELEQALQAEWEQSFALLLNQSATLEQRLAWLEQHFFKLELIGFERADIQFKEYGVTESLLTILLNEILVNAFKYYSSASKPPVVLEWTEREGYQILICRNPSIRSERTIIKGSHKGHTFLSTLARKTGSAFTKPTPQDDFVVEFGIPDELLISK